MIDNIIRIQGAPFRIRLALAVVDAADSIAMAMMASQVDAMADRTSIELSNCVFASQAFFRGRAIVVVMRHVHGGMAEMQEQF